jgi:hypothetical protein
VTKPLNSPVVIGRVETQLSLKKAQDALKIAHDRMKRDLETAARVIYAQKMGLQPDTKCSELVLE